MIQIYSLKILGWGDSLKLIFEDGNMAVIADFCVSTFEKAFLPETISLLHPAGSFETNAISISSILVEFDTSDCVIAFPEYQLNFT